MFISPIGAVATSATRVSNVRRNQPEQTVQTNPTQPIPSDSVSFKGGNYAEVFETQFNRKLRNINSVRDAFNELILALDKRKLFFGNTELSKSAIKKYYDNLDKGDVISLDANLAVLSLGRPEVRDIANAAKKINERMPNYFLPIINKENGGSGSLFGIRNFGRYTDKPARDRRCDDVRLLFLDENEVSLTGSDTSTKRVIVFAEDSDNDFIIGRGYYPDLYESYETYYKQEMGGKLKERITANDDGEMVVEQFKPDGTIDEGEALSPAEATARMLELGLKRTINSISKILGL